MLAALILWTLHRAWTYTYLVPLISGWSEGVPGAPMTAAEVGQARTWVNLSWIRTVIDLTTMVLALLAFSQHVAAGTLLSSVPQRHRATR
jgi:hypothetical protein